MRPSTILYLYRVRLRARLTQELFAVAGIAIGVALLFASQVANTSLSGSVTRLTDELIGKSRLQLTARDPLGFSQRLLGDVQRLPGVLTAAPVLERSAYLVGPRGSASVDLIGINASFASLEGRLVQRINPSRLPGQQGVALPASVASQIGVGPLQSLLLQVGAKSTGTVAAAILRSADVGQLVDSPLAIVSLAMSQRMAAMPGQITRVVVEPRAGQDQIVRRELEALAGGRLNVSSADFDATVFKQAEGPTSQSTLLFSTISALVGFMFAFNAMLLTVPQRRRLIGDLRLDGYPPLEIVEVMVFDALVLGVVGSIVGMLLGDLLARGLLQTNPGYLSFAFPVGSEQIVSWQSVVLPLAGGLLAAFVGVTVPLRHDIFVREGRPVHAVSRPSPFRLHLLVGLSGLIAVAALLLVGIHDVDVATAAFVILVVAMLAILPVAFRLAVGVFDLVQRVVAGVSSRIAVIELQSGATRARSLAIVATGAIAVFGSVAVEGARQDLERGLSQVARETARVADIWVSPRGRSNTLGTTPFAGGYAPRIRRLAGVASVSVYRAAFLDIGDRRSLVIASPRDSLLPVPVTQVVQGNPVQAGRLVATGGWATLSQALAGRLHLRIGQPFELPTSAPFRFRLAAVTSNLGWPPGAVITNADDFAKAWGNPQPTAYQVNVRSSASVPVVQREIEALLGARSGLAVQTGQQREAAYRLTQRQGLARLNEIAGLILIAAALAMAAAMAAMIWQRRPRLAGMKVDGFDQGELWRALLYESAVLLGAGCCIGAAFGLYGQAVLTHALAGVTGFPVVFDIGDTIAIVIVAGVTAVAVSIAALPGYLAAQVKPALQD